MGKAYVNRLPKEKRPDSDFYPTPTSLVHLLVKTGVLDGVNTILEPACGDGAFVDVLKSYGFKVDGSDIKFGDDFLKKSYGYYDAVVTNPPFSLFDEFVEKAKSVSDKVIFIGKTNFLGVQSRLNNGVWEGLSDIFVFSRMVDYRSKPRSDGKFICGNLVTGFFVWDENWKEKYCRTSVLDVSPYVLRKGRKDA